MNAGATTTTEGEEAEKKEKGWGKRRKPRGEGISYS